MKPAERLHARLGASSAHRWWKCPASIRLSEGQPNESSIFAMEGTAAHSLGEHTLRSGEDADLYLGKFVGQHGLVNAIAEDEKAGIFEVTAEMVEAVQVYLDAVRGVMQPGDILVVEQKFDLSRLHPEMFGTADAVVYRPSTGELFVFDFKYGQGVAVEVVENEQQLFYSLGAALHEPGRKLTTVTMAIVQPRCWHEDGPVRKWSISAVDLLDWAADLVEAAQRTTDHSIEPVAGDHCKWCPAAGTCNALRQKACEAAHADFTSAGEIVLSPVNSFSGATLSDILRHADVIEEWIKAVRAKAHHEAEAGRCPEGFKLVAKRANRKWRDEAEARGMCRQWGLEPEQFVTEKLKTPAMIEKLLPKDLRGQIGDFVTQVSSGSTLVETSDKRAAVVAAAETEFPPVAGSHDFP